MSRNRALRSPVTAATAIKRLLNGIPRIALVLGSGFGRIAENLAESRTISYRRLPGWPVGSVEGHAGKLVAGSLNGIPVLVLAGRAHFYEGFDLAETTYPVRVLAELGIDTILFTNAAGGIAKGMCPGDFMAIDDHINFMGVNPLRGPVASGRERFLDMTHAYDLELVGFIESAAKKAKVRIHRGVYLAVSGPSFETPAEIRAFRSLGASAVGMSTVPEVIVARQCGLRVAGLSCITNVAAGMGGKDQKVDHVEVLETVNKVTSVARALLGEFVGFWAAGQ
jgi:inosine/guanosine/xanthosine phosphorylase family protein